MMTLQEQETIIKSALKVYNTSLDRVLSKGRKRDVVLCREAIAFKLRGYRIIRSIDGKLEYVQDDRRMNLQQVAEKLGRINHTTICNNINSVTFCIDYPDSSSDRDATQRLKLQELEKEVDKELLNENKNQMGRQIPEKYINKLFRSKAYVDKLKDKESEYVIWERFSGAKELHKKSDFSDEVLKGWKKDGKIYDAFIVPQKDMEEEFINDFINDFIISSYLNEDEDGEDK